MTDDLRAYIDCSHCGVEFLASPRQTLRIKYEPERSKYCSLICRSAGSSASLRRPFPYWATCPTCGKQFGSRAPKKFCRMACYHGSEQFKAMVKEASAKALAVRRANPRPPLLKGRICLECDTEFFRKPSVKLKYCSRRCYRAYMAKRFDRWIASPQSIALPQAYDEFLLADQLPCLVEDCGWRGANLSLHMNLAHGVQAEDFKRAAGFNLNTGVVGMTLHETLSDRPNVGIGLAEWARTGDRASTLGNRRNYSSLEGREHGAKGRALAHHAIGPVARTCLNCGTTFHQATPFGRAKYCSLRCRAVQYQKKNAAKIYQLQCGLCDSLFQGNRGQYMRSERALAVYCSAHCRQKHNWRGRLRKT